SNPTSAMNTTPKGLNHRSSKQKVENSNLEGHLPPVVTMADNRTMAELLHAPIEGYKDLLRACPHHGFTKLHQLNTFYNALNPADQDSLNAAADGNLLERSTQDVLTIIENKSKVRNSRSKPIASQVKACDTNSNSEIAKLTHAVNQQTSVVTTAMTATLKQFQVTPPPAPVKAVEEICVTCGATAQQNQNFHLNELEKIKRMNEANMKAMQTQIDMVKNELRTKMKSSIQTSLSNQTNEIKNIMASLLQMNIASTLGLGSLSSNTVANPKGELKAITTRSGLVTDGPTVPTPSKSITPEVDERVEETYTDPDLAEYSIKVPPPPIQKYKPPSQREFVVHKMDPLYPNIPYPSRMLKQKHELECKTLADLGASINLMPLSVWKKLCLPELILTRMTLELANRAICTPDGIARDVFVPVGKFTFPADFVIVDYESDPRMILRDGDERLTLNMKHDTSSYSNQPQGESVNLINIFNVSSEDFLEVLFSNQPSGNPTFSHHQELTSPEVNNDIFDSEGCNVLSEKLPDLNYTKDLHPPLDDNLLSGSTTYSSNSFLEEFTDELALITYPSEYDDNLQFDIEFDLKEIEFLLYQDKDSKVEPDAENVYDDPFDSKREKIKESKLLIDELDLPCVFLPPFEYDSFISQDFSKVDALPSTNNKDKDFDPLFYEPLFFKEVPKAKMLLLFSSENEEKVFKLGIHNSEKVHSYFIPELSYPGYYVFKINQIFKSPMKIFLHYGKDTPILDVPLFHFYSP
nr:hypothetical protein [Tanacetum cinerariifolium]